MEALLKTVKENRKVRDSTIKIYKRHLNKLSNKIHDKDYSGREFLKTDVKKRLRNFLKEQSSSTMKNYVASILVALSPKERRNL